MYSLLQYIGYIMLSLLLWPACRKHTADEKPLEVEMLSAVNTVRQTGCTCGADYMPPVNPLVWNDTLAAAALVHARDMEANNYLSHLSVNGASPIQRTLSQGYQGNTVTENIARGYSALEPLLDAWLQSEAHCKAMMDPLHREMGAARAGTYWVQEFGSYR